MTKVDYYSVKIDYSLVLIWFQWNNRDIMLCSSTCIKAWHECGCSSSAGN